MRELILKTLKGKKHPDETPHDYAVDNDQKTDPLFHMLKEQYDNLSIAYLRKGMKREAEVFSKVVTELGTLEREIRKSGS